MPLCFWTGFRFLYSVIVLSEVMFIVFAPPVLPNVEMICYQTGFLNTSPLSSSLKKEKSEVQEMHMCCYFATLFDILSHNHTSFYALHMCPNNFWGSLYNFFKRFVFTLGKVFWHVDKFLYPICNHFELSC